MRDWHGSSGQDYLEMQRGASIWVEALQRARWRMRIDGHRCRGRPLEFGDDKGHRRMRRSPWGRVQPGKITSAAEAENYHASRSAVQDTAAAMVTAITMNYVEEAVGLTRAAARAGMPVAISFTVETDGRLPTGQTLSAAIEQVDAATSRYPAYYMINCAHPTHFEHVLTAEEPWTQRIRGLRANASPKSHAELNESAELDIGDPVELGMQYAELGRRLPQLNVMGGCCGTDHRHVEQIAAACLPLFRGTT
jgi:S-methylmethionine-dependent homocysteine/selenocysteine methylase